MWAIRECNALVWDLRAGRSYGKQRRDLLRDAPPLPANMLLAVGLSLKDFRLPRFGKLDGLYMIQGSKDGRTCDTPSFSRALRRGSQVDIRLTPTCKRRVLFLLRHATGGHTNLGTAPVLAPS